MWERKDLSPTTVLPRPVSHDTPSPKKVNYYLITTNISSQFIFSLVENIESNSLKQAYTRVCKNR
jgi:cAMP phosphodiesterase